MQRHFKMFRIKAGSLNILHAVTTCGRTEGGLQVQGCYRAAAAPILCCRSRPSKGRGCRPNLTTVTACCSIHPPHPTVCHRIFAKVLFLCREGGRHGAGRGAKPLLPLSPESTALLYPFVGACSCPVSSSPRCILFTHHACVGSRRPRDGWPWPLGLRVALCDAAGDHVGRFAAVITPGLRTPAVCEGDRQGACSGVAVGHTQG